MSRGRRGSRGGRASGARSASPVVPAGGVSGLLLAGVLVYALNLRSPITAVPPIIDRISESLALSPAQAGLLTSIPVLCFAVLTPPASALLARLGIGSAVALSIATVLAGTLIRSSGDYAAAIVGTVLIGAAIAVGNVAVPVIISRDFPGAASTVTGLYSAAMNLGSVLTTMLTAPLADAVGWRGALLAWAALAVVGLVLWRYAAVHLRPTDARPELAAGLAAPPRGVFRRALTWLLAIGFAGQAFSYYATTAWLPSLLGDELDISRSGAGAAASLFQAFAIVGAIGVPLALRRRAPVRLVTLAMIATWVSLPIGLLTAPGGWPLWCSLAGIAQGGNFTVIFTLIAERTRSTQETRQMSTVVQTAGFACAAAGPTLLGAVHSATGGWDAPMGVILGALGVMGAAVLLASSRRHA